MIYIQHDNEQYEKALAFLHSCRTISLDTETTGLDPLQDMVLLIQVGNKYQQYVFDVARLGKAIQKLKPILESTTTIKLLHNAKYDYEMLKGHLNITLENIQCVMINEQLLVNGRKVSSSLETLAKKYTRAELNKSVRETFKNTKFGDEFTQEQLTYAAEDVIYLEEIRAAQFKLLTKHNLMKVWRIETDVIPAMGDLELAGAYVDRDLWTQAENETKLEQSLVYNELNILFAKIIPVDMFGVPAINYNSPKQLLPILKKVLGTSGRKLESTGVDVLQDYAGNEYIDAILKYRKIEKRLSTYGSEFLQHIHPVTGRVHSNFFQLGGLYDENKSDKKDGTGTGRLSSKNP